MDILEKTKIDLVKAINDYLKEDIISVDDIVYPPNSEMGDLSLPTFKISKKLGKSSGEIGLEFMSNIFHKQVSILDSVLTVGAYLNFKLDREKLSTNILGEILKEKGDYGRKEFRENEKIMLEFSNGTEWRIYVDKETGKLTIYSD